MFLPTPRFAQNLLLSAAMGIHETDALKAVENQNERICFGAKYFLRSIHSFFHNEHFM